MKDVLEGKKIVLGVSGCIAAYKISYLVREYKKRGAEVKVVMTPSACEFITPLTLSTLSGNEVITQMFPKTQDGNVGVSAWHIEYGLWADIMVIAPASVNTVAKIAGGIADNALTTLTLAMRAPIIVSPAADMDMYENPVTTENIEKLSKRGMYIIDAEQGHLASGLCGRGRLPDLGKIIDATEMILSGYTKDLTGKRVLVSGGPTYEDIDPVRFIGNRSSGKMGYQIAKAAYLRGADVTLISGPVSQEAYQGITVVPVRSAGEMKTAVDNHIGQNDVLLMSAAVADYKPSEYKDKKVKKGESFGSIELIDTEDILASIDKSGTFVVGFALETDDEHTNAIDKLKRKNLDMIVLNSLRYEGGGFEVDTNVVTIFTKNGEEIELPLMSKLQVAHNILNQVVKQM